MRTESGRPEEAGPAVEDGLRDLRRWLGRVWVAAYVLWMVTRLRYGFSPATIPLTLLLLGLPPVLGAVLSSQRILRRTRTAHPGEWDRMRRGDWTGLEMRFFLTDARDLGDPELRKEKGRLRRWILAGTVAIALYLPSLFLIAALGD